MSYRTVILPVLALLLGLGGPPAHATVLRSLNLTELCDTSPTIVRGRVVQTRSAWRGGRIYTAVTLRVNRSLSGAKRAGDTVTFWRLGGAVGRIAQRVIGAPRFRAGEQVVVFLHTRRGRLFVTGMLQGKVRVLPATNTSPARVTPTVQRVQFQGTRRVLARVMALTTFEAQVTALVRSRASRKGPRP